MILIINLTTNKTYFRNPKIQCVPRIGDKVFEENEGSFTVHDVVWYPSRYYVSQFAGQEVYCDALVFLKG